MSGGDVNLGSSVLDTVTSVAGSASPGGTAQDSYGAPQVKYQHRVHLMVQMGLYAYMKILHKT